MMSLREMAKNRVIRMLSNHVEGRSGERVTVSRVSIGKGADCLCWCCLVAYKSDRDMDWFVSGCFNEWGDPEIDHVDYVRVCVTSEGTDLVPFSISKKYVDRYLFRD